MKMKHFMVVLLAASLALPAADAFAKDKGGPGGGPGVGEKKGWQDGTPRGWFKGKKKGWKGEKMAPGQMKKVENAVEEKKPG